MRTLITISFVSIFVIFILVIVSSSQSSASSNEPLMEGQVLGVSESLVGGMYEQYSFKDLGFPEPETKPELFDDDIKPTKNSQTTSLADFNCPMIVMDKKTGEILYSEDSEKIVPIASITKLMTALVVIENIKDFDAYYKVTSEDMVAGGQYYLKVGEEVLVSDLLQLSLVASANSATQALVGATGLGNSVFVEKMNEKAKALGLEKTSFSDAIGLSYYNQSNPLEIAKLLTEASNNEVIKEILKKQNYQFSTKAGRIVSVYSTNNLLNKYPKEETAILGGKTGHTNSAGYCLTSSFSQDGNDVIAVVMGAQESYQRFAYTEKIVDWVFDSYTWQ